VAQLDGRPYTRRVLTERLDALYTDHLRRPDA
jgi:hypothetical protein